MNLKDYFHFIILNPSNYKQVGRELRNLQDSELADKERIEQIQARKLKELILHAQGSVGYWNRMFLGQIDQLDSSNTLEFIKKLPKLTKPIVRKQGEKMWSKDISEYIVATTGGTTGHPLTVRRDLSCNAITKAALWRSRISWGVNPGDRTIYLNSFGKGTRKGRFRMKLAHKRLGEAFPSSDEDVLLIAKEIEAFKPKCIEGFATGLLESTRRKTSGRTPKVPVIVSTGEMLYAHQRKALEEYYGGEIFTYYGSNEIGSIAFECEHHSLHLCEEHVYVETVDENGDNVINQPGNILVTDLDNKAMPFIRYELGDIAVISDEPCSCGRSSRVISELVGRSQDFLSGSEGRKLQATQLSAYLKDLKATGQLQFIQQASGTVLICYDGKEIEAADELKTIGAHLYNRLGNDLSIEFKHVEEIQKTQRGKQALVVRKSN